ncbi:MAG: response regulator [Lachnospiraceae bacterium]|nr:response regulator [Lachnospiraceae bacterium]
MIQLTYTGSRQEEVVDAAREWRDTIEGKTGQTILVVFSMGFSPDELNQLMDRASSGVKKEYVLGISKRLEKGEDPVIRMTFLFLEYSRAIPFSYHTGKGEIWEACLEMEQTILQTEHCKGVLCFAAGNTLKLSMPLGAVEESTGVPIFGLWSTELTREAPEEFFIFKDEKMESGIGGFYLVGERLQIQTLVLNGWKMLGRSFPLKVREYVDDLSVGETVVAEIDHQPAADIYRHYLKVKKGPAFIENIREFPFSLVRGSQQIQRIPLRYDDAGELYFIGDIYPDDRICFSYADPQRMLEETLEKSRIILDILPEAAFFFGSVLRRKTMGEEDVEVQGFQSYLPNIFYARSSAQIFYNNGEGAILNANSVVVSMQETEGEITRLEISTEEAKEETYYNWDEVIPLADRTAAFMMAITDDLNDAVEKTESANRAKSEFLSNMSHEIRTPINAILGMDEMILRRAEDKSILSYAQDLRQAGNGLLGIINDILDFSKIEAGKLSILPVDYKPSEMIRDLYQMLKKRAEDKSLILVIEADPHIPDILYGDEIRMKQVITNLLTNAVKYTERGKVTLRILLDGVKDQDVMIRVEVEDTGIGIKEEDKEKLFTSFQRLDEERNRTIEGTGLGLNITLSLLRLMGSSLAVDSVYGEGSTFSFVVRQGSHSVQEMGELDLTRHEGTMERRGAAFVAPDVRILAVDDTEMNLKVLKELLAQNEVMIDTATSGKEALEMLKEIAYDLILLDYRMPQMNGVETLKHIFKMKNWRPVPVICLTANAVTGAIETYLEAGFTDVITKPVQPELLEQKMMQYLPKELLKVNKHPVVVSQKPEEDLPALVSKMDPRLLEMEGLSLEDGIRNNGSVKTYMEVLKTYYKGLSGQLDKIEELFEAGNIKDYTIKVHALKSSSRIIGALEVADLAEALEKAGDEEYIAKIIQDTPILMTNARLLYRDLGNVFAEEEKPKEDLIPMDDGTWTDAMVTICELVGAYDHKSIRQVLEALGSYSLDEDRQKLYDGLKEAAAGPDWERLQKLLG